MALMRTILGIANINRMVGGGLGVSLILLVPGPTSADQFQFASATAAGEDLQKSWGSFRGPGAIERAFDANPPISWNVAEGTNVLWKSSTPKHGVSSPIVWKDRLFLTGADEVSRQIYCLHADTGQLLWQHDVAAIPGSPPDDRLPRVMEETGLAAPTATTNGRYVAAVFATGELACVNMKGERIWAKHLGIPKNHYGHSSSLISHGNLLFVQYDQDEDSKLLAFDLASGDSVWQAKRDVISWASPILIDNKGRMELILANSKAVDSYDPKTGQHLWRVACLDGEVAPSAAYGGGAVFVASDFATASAIDIGNHGAEPQIRWQWDEALPDAASPVANDDYLVLPTGFGVVSCLDVHTGEVFWEHEFDGGFYSSPVLANDRVYIVDLSGTMQIFKMSDQFELLGTAELGEGAYATPALVGDKIYIRGLSHLFCIKTDSK